MQANSPNIVRGRVLNDAEIVARYHYPYFPERRLTGQNAVSLEVLEVFQGDIQVGDIIRITEPYNIENGILFSIANYLPSVPYQEYFFFLQNQRASVMDPGNLGLENTFPVMEGYRGRFPVPTVTEIGAIEIFNRTLDIDNLQEVLLERNIISPDINIIHGHGVSRLYDINVMFSTAGRANMYEYLDIWQEVISEFMN